MKKQLRHEKTNTRTYAGWVVFVIGARGGRVARWRGGVAGLAEGGAESRGWRQGGRGGEVRVRRYVLTERGWVV